MLQRSFFVLWKTKTSVELTKRWRQEYKKCPGAFSRFRRQKIWGAVETLEVALGPQILGFRTREWRGGQRVREVLGKQ
jgi:hypothetical protein